MLDIRRWQSYVEPGDESDTGSPSKRISRNMDQSFSERSNGIVEEELLPLPEDTLARNLGLDLIVVVAKVTMKYSFFTKFSHELKDNISFYLIIPSFTTY